MYFRHRLKLRDTFKRSTQIFKSSLRNHISVGINALKTDITKADMIKEICIPLLLNVSSLESNYTDRDSVREKSHRNVCRFQNIKL